MPRGKSQLGGRVNRSVHAKARPSGTRQDAIGMKRQSSNKKTTRK